MWDRRERERSRGSQGSGPKALGRWSWFTEEWGLEEGRGLRLGHVRSEMCSGHTRGSVRQEGR